MTAKTLLPAASIEPAGNGFQVVRGPRRLTTPAGLPLTLPTEKLAAAIAAEWQLNIGPGTETPPMIALAATWQDRIAPQRAAMNDALMDYLDIDLCCYHTPEPPELAERQAGEWGDVCTRIAARYGTMPATTPAVIEITQPPVLRSAIAADIAAMSDIDFTALQVMAAALGSIFIALLLHHRTCTVEQAVKLRFLEEDYYAALGGIDAHGPDPLTEAARDALRTELENALEFRALATLE